MVFGFGKKKKAPPEPIRIRQTPSLPQVVRGETGTGAVGVAWPSSLVDREELQRFENEFAVGYAQSNGHDASYQPTENGPKSGRKISFSQSRTTPFHRPFRPYASLGPGGNTASSSPTNPDVNAPPSAYSNGHGGRLSTFTARSKTRRTKTSPVFNVMVVGAQGTGKTSLLSLLLSTSDLSPTTTLDQRANLENFLSNCTSSAQAHTPTESITTLQLEILDSPATSLLLTVVDTPGLDFNSGKELVLEGQVRAVVREIERRYGESMVEEARVIRGGRGEGFLHLCIYLIDPASITSGGTIVNENAASAAGDAAQRPPSPAESSASASSNGSSTSLRGDDAATPTKSSHAKSLPLHMHPSDLKTLKRLHGKVNILPVIARIDSLTEERLGMVKNAVRRELDNAGIGFGVFGLSREERKERGRKRSTPTTTPTKSRPGVGAEDGSDRRGSAKRRPPPLKTTSRDSDTSEDEEAEAEDAYGPQTPVSPTTPTASSKPKVIKIRSTRPYVTSMTDERSTTPQTAHTPTLTRSRSHSRIRRAHTHSNESDEEFDLARGRMAIDDEIAAFYGNGDDNTQEEGGGGGGDRRRMSYASMRFYDHARSLRLSDINEGSTGAAAEREVDALLPFGLVNPEPRKPKKKHHRRHSSVDGSGLGMMDQNQQNNAGMFVRKFRWGTIDVLDPLHCDFVPMRSAVFGSHLKSLKHQTKAFYESYRTEKLLIRKARQMGYRDVDGTVDLKSSVGHGTPPRESRSRERKAGGKEEWVDVAALERSYSTDIRKTTEINGGTRNGIVAH